MGEKDKHPFHPGNWSHISKLLFIDGFKVHTCQVRLGIDKKSWYLEWLDFYTRIEAYK